MDDLYEHDHQLRALAMRVAALEDNVAFLEEWCEEQQDVLDRTAGAVAYDYEAGPRPEATQRAVLRIVDLRDEAGVAEVEADPTETEHERKMRELRARLTWLKSRLRSTI